MRRARALPLLIAIAACRTPPARTGEPPAGPDAGVTPPAGDPDAAVAEAAPAPLTDAECVQFVEHTLEIGMAQQRATKPSDYVPTADQVGAIRAKLIASRPCDGMSRLQWTCALEATTQQALYACAQ